MSPALKCLVVVISVRLFTVCHLVHLEHCITSHLRNSQYVVLLSLLDVKQALFIHDSTKILVIELYNSKKIVKIKAALTTKWLTF